MRYVDMSNQFASGKCQLFIIRRGKNLSEAEHVRGLAKELIENEEWAIEKSVADKNLKSKLKTSQKGGGA